MSPTWPLAGTAHALQPEPGARGPRLPWLSVYARAAYGIPTKAVWTVQVFEASRMGLLGRMLG